jgi:hypothetical protein
MCVVCECACVCACVHARRRARRRRRCGRRWGSCGGKGCWACTRAPMPCSAASSRCAPPPPPLSPSLSLSWPLDPGAAFIQMNGRACVDKDMLRYNPLHSPRSHTRPQCPSRAQSGCAPPPLPFLPSLPGSVGPVWVVALPPAVDGGRRGNRACICSFFWSMRQGQKKKQGRKETREASMQPACCPAVGGVAISDGIRPLSRMG